MSKLANKAKSSKLRDSIQADELNYIAPKERIIRQIKPKDYPRSYRLDPESLNILKDTLNRVNEISPRKISEARLVKALIILSKTVDEEKLLKYLKEVW